MVTSSSNNLSCYFNIFVVIYICFGSVVVELLLLFVLLFLVLLLLWLLLLLLLSYILIEQATVASYTKFKILRCPENPYFEATRD